MVIDKFLLKLSVQITCTVMFCLNLTIGLVKICLDAGTADAWTPVIEVPVIDAGTAVQRVQ